MLLLICALFPVAAGGVLAYLPIKNRKIRMACYFGATVITSILAGFAVFSGEQGSLELFRLSDQFICSLALDGAGKVYLGLAALLWPFATLYAIEYMSHEKREGNFFSWYTITYGAAVMLAVSENLFTLYMSYEFLTLCTVPLIWHEQDKKSIRAVRWYMIFLFGGAALGFVAMMGLYVIGAGEFRPGGVSLSAYGNWSLWLALMGFIGFGVKAAVLPLSRWLPMASVAPTPVTALLHAVAVVNAGVFSVMRILYYVCSPAEIFGTWAQTVMLILSALTIVYGAVMAVREQHIKRRLAWSTVSNLSYMLFGLSLLTGPGMAAGLSHMVFHGMTKIILFFCAGAVMVQTGRTQVREMHGLGRVMPVTFAAYSLAGVSLMGVPPLPGFVSKSSLIMTAFHQGGALPIMGAVALLISSVLTTIYIFTVAFPAFFMKQAPAGEIHQNCDPGICMKITLVGLCILLIAAGALAGPVMNYLNGIAGGIGA